MDKLDRKIIDMLQHDGRAGQAELAAATGLAVSSVHERLKKLQAAGVVRIVGLADPAALGLPVLAFVSVLLERPEHDPPFRAAIRTYPQVLECHHVAGEWSFLLKVRADSLLGLEAALGQIKALAGVVRMHTTITLSTVKESHCLPVMAGAL